MASEYGDIVRKGFDKACECFTERVESPGFFRDRTRFGCGLRALTADLVYFHRGGCSHGAPMNAEADIRIHFGIGVHHDANDAPRHLNGRISPFTKALDGVK